MLIGNCTHNLVITFDGKQAADLQHAAVVFLGQCCGTWTNAPSNAKIEPSYCATMLTNTINGFSALVLQRHSGDRGDDG